jgi:hypothetical protein
MCKVARDKLIPCGESNVSPSVSEGSEAVRRACSTVMNGHARDERAPEAGQATPGCARVA